MILRIILNVFTFQSKNHIFKKQCKACRGIYSPFKKCPLQVDKEEFTSGFFLSGAALSPVLSIIEKVLEDGGILRIYGYILFHDSVENKRYLDQWMSCHVRAKETYEVIDWRFTIVSSVKALNNHVTCMAVNTVKCRNIVNAVFFFFFNYK